jgi:CubicO group peptidase (beta-lactamase class C family)
MTQLLPRGTQGFDPAALEGFIRAVEEQRLGVHSVMVVRHGHVVAEEWWAPYTPEQPHIMFSVSKAFTSAAVGIAAAEGRVSLDEPVLNVFPSYASPRVRRNMGAVQIRHLLAMASGHAIDTMHFMRHLPEHDWIEIFLSVAPEYPPGSYFCYDSGASHVLSAIVQARTGQTVRDYLMPRLFEPLGIAEPAVESSPRGINLGASGFRLRTEELAAFGQLYLQGGEWGGRRLLPAAWVAEASTSAVSTAGGENPDWAAGYGFQLWRGRHNSFRADGAFGQFSLVLPDRDAVVAITSGTRATQGVLNAVWDKLLPGLSDSAGDRSATATTRHPDLWLPVPRPALGPVPAVICGRQIQLEANSLELTDLTLSDDGAAIVLTAHGWDGAEHVVRSGRTDWIFGESDLWTYEEPSSTLTVAGRVGAVETDLVTLLWQYVQTPFRRTVTVRQVGEGTVDVTFELDLPFWRERREPVRGHW